MMTYYSHAEPRQLFLDTLSDFYQKMGDKAFWAKTDEQRQIALDAVNQDYLRVEHGTHIEQDAIALQAALDEYIRRQIHIVGATK